MIIANFKGNARTGSGGTGGGSGGGGGMDVGVLTRGWAASGYIDAAERSLVDCGACMFEWMPLGADYAAPEPIYTDPQGNVVESSLCFDAAVHAPRDLVDTFVMARRNLARRHVLADLPWVVYTGRPPRSAMAMQTGSPAQDEYFTRCLGPFVSLARTCRVLVALDASSEGTPGERRVVDDCAAWLADRRIGVLAEAGPRAGSAPLGVGYVDRLGLLLGRFASPGWDQSRVSECWLQVTHNDGLERQDPELLTAGSMHAARARLAVRAARLLGAGVRALVCALDTWRWAGVDVAATVREMREAARG